MEYVLITGGCGYIGSHISVVLLQNNYNIIIIDNLCNSDISTLENIKEITGKTPLFFNINLLDIQSLNTIFKEYTISTVIHTAGYKSVPESVKNPIKYYENNVITTINLIKCMNENHCNKLIFSSSYCVYETTDSDLNEYMPVSTGINSYGNTKYLIEKMLDDIELNIICLRYFNPIGSHSSGLIGEPINLSTGIMSFIIKTALGINDCLNISTDINGNSATRDFLHVEDLAEAHIKTLEYIKINPCKNIKINICSGKKTQIIDLLKIFEKVNDMEIFYKKGVCRPGDVHYIVGDPTKAFKLLGWRAKIKIEDMCKSSWNYAVNKYINFI